MVVLSLIYVRGWIALKYDKNDEEIGNKIVFTRQMVRLNSLPKNMVSGVIAKKYGSILEEKTQWIIDTAWFPNVDAEDVPCDEVFSTKEAFYETHHGILEATFSAGNIKYYVLISEKYEKTIVTESDYDAYSKDVDTITGPNRCIGG